MVRVRVQQKGRIKAQKGGRIATRQSVNDFDLSECSGQNKLTPMQLSVLRFIEMSVSEVGAAPTLREMADHFGKALGTIQDHVKALKQKGLLTDVNSEQRSARGLLVANRAPSISIPILGFVPAGGPSDAIESAEGFLSFTPPSQLNSNRQGASLFALRVRGDSMQDVGILEGDLVIVNQQGNANHGDIIVAMIDGQATVKTFDKKRMRLIPENPKYDPIVLDPTRANTILGKVVSVQRFYGAL